MTALQFLMGLVLLGLLCALLQLSCLAIALRIERRRAFSGFMPPLSILKPLRGVDESLEMNLESFCNQDYRDYEIILTVLGADDPALAVARKVKASHPLHDISIIVHDSDVTYNPKINNLLPALQAARHELLLISDSNVVVEKEYLRTTVRAMEDPRVGLVHSLIKGGGEESFGSTLENMHLNTFIAGSVAFLDRFFSLPCVVGKSMLLRRAALSEIGGLEAYGGFLAEDYIIGRQMKRSGWKVFLCGHPVRNLNRKRSFEGFVERHTRWAKLRRNISGIGYAAELLLNPTFVCLPLLLVGGGTAGVLSFTAAVLLTKAMADAAMVRLVGGSLSPLASGVFSPVKDIAAGLLWFVPFVSRTVSWRGHRFLISRDSVLSPLDKGAVEPGESRHSILETLGTS
jgi:ceramide glucosyltransferase